jgi:acetyl-CoA C-acetyltransferase
MSKILITAAKRSAIGTFMGSLKDVSAVDLGVTTTRAILSGVESKNGADLKDIADVIVGNVLQAGQGMNPARQIAIKSGLPQHVAGQTINRVCGSGMQAVITAVQALKCGDGELYLAGGIESMSRAPFLIHGMRAGHRYGSSELIDSIQKDGLTDVFGGEAMGMTAENVAAQWNISRGEQDAYAVESHRRAAASIAANAFQDEIVPVEIPGRKGVIVFAQDEHLRPDTTTDVLAKLKPAFKADGTVTAGNASGINDGAAMLMLATEDYAHSHGIAPIAEIMSYATIGVDPATMGIGPSSAVPLALQRAKLAVNDIDLFELNEAFAATSLAVMQDLKLDPTKVNIGGGAIALGHPIGASGARVLVTLIHALRRTGGKFGVASLCIGGGMGIAVVIKVF